MTENYSSTLKLNLKLDTVRSAVESGAQCFDDANLFYGHGTATAIDEAAYLVSFVLGTSPIIQESEIELVLSSSQKDKIRSLFTTRVTKKIPAAYITNEAWFAGYQFYIDERVLVPRSPLAEIIDDKFSPWVTWGNKTKTVLDLCTGSGCIAIATALTMSDVKVHASDISVDALDVAKKNIDNYELFNRVSLIKSDIFDQIVDFRYDVIISNPPYVDAHDMSNLHHEFLAEPLLGLEAGKYGLDIVIPMLAEAGPYLTDDGIIIVEVGNSAVALEKMFPEIAFTWLEFEYGGGGVFLLDAKQLQKYNYLFREKC
ncbi:Ribosomal protein L3 N(5)-glutamine methyltransferase [hydrothermal vent metagenome]|uniref:Ribosomal protein L3 N(5)-glutamine methyltransferase n=1 Tax=hydrothermal vent metagenome TaxID=652676 RepID=A0A3B1AK22_9ZZZZ